MTRINYPEMFQRQVANGDVHRAGGAGCIGVFELKTVPSALDPHHEVKFGAGLGSPEVQVPAFQRTDHLLQGKAFPGSSEFRMRLHVREASQLEQGVQKATVPKVDLGCLDLPLADILKPGRKDSDHIGTRKNVKVTPSRVFGGAERPGKLGGIPDLTVVMSDHRPETSQGLGGNRNSKLRNISFEKCSDKVIAPDDARSVVDR